MKAGGKGEDKKKGSCERLQRKKKFSRGRACSPLNHTISCMNPHVMYEPSRPTVAKTSSSALVVADSGGGACGSYSTSNGSRLPRAEKTNDHTGVRYTYLLDVHQGTYTAVSTQSVSHAACEYDFVEHFEAVNQS